MSQPKVRSTTQRRGMTLKPFWPGSRRVTSTPQALVILGWALAMCESRWMPPALSETLAAVTQTPRSRPRVSMPMWRLRLARVDALAGSRDIGGRLDALGVQHARVRFGVPARGLPEQSAKQAVELVEYAVLLPGGEISVDGFPRREVVGKVAPGDPGPVHIQNCRAEVPPPRGRARIAVLTRSRTGPDQQDHDSWSVRRPVP